MSTWQSPQPPPSMRLGAWQRVRAAWRFALLALALLPGLLALVLARGLECMTHDGAWRMSPHVVHVYSRFLLRVVGLRLDRQGAGVTARGALVANHVSWLDIFVLSALTPARFVAKQEVAGWPGIGLLARLAGSVFIHRDRRDAGAQVQALTVELRRGHRLVFFPEGTSTDGTLVLPFKATLFEAFVMPDIPQNVCVQPVSLRYDAPPGADPRFYGWWGEMEFAAHFLRVLGQRPQGRVTVTCHPSIPCAPDMTRKALAARAEAAARDGFAAM